MKKIKEIFKSLSDESRLRIINLFIKSGQKLCVCELMDALKIPQYTISKSLNTLKNADLLTAEKKGTWTYYELKINSHNKPVFVFLKKYLIEGAFLEDTLRLNERLLLREDDICVVGIIPKCDLEKKIKQKIKE